MQGRKQSYVCEKTHCNPYGEKLLRKKSKQMVYLFACDEGEEPCMVSGFFGLFICLFVLLLIV